MSQNQTKVDLGSPASAPKGRSKGPSPAGRTGPLPVTEALQLVESWSDPSSTRRRDLASAIVAVIKMSGMPKASVELTPSFVRRHVMTVTAAMFGVSRSRLYNIRAQMRYVLRRTGVIDEANTPLSIEWQGLLSDLNKQQRYGLVGFGRFCSARGIALSDVKDETLAHYLTQLTDRTVQPKPTELVSRVRHIWNHAATARADWPQRPLALPGAPEPFIKPLSSFPAAFREALQAFRDHLTARISETEFSDDEGDDNVPLPTDLKPVRQLTAERRMSHARWAASALVNSGFPIADITSLNELVVPLLRAKTIFRQVYEAAGQKPSHRGRHVADVITIIAKHIVRLPEQDLARIQDWGRRIKFVQKGLTSKNESQIRQALQPTRDLKLLELPDTLMRSARELRHRTPNTAAFRAMVGTAITLFSRRMLRLSNVTGLRLDTHLQRADPKSGRIAHIYIPAEETKNRRTISLPVPADMARMLHEWITVFRPLIASPDCVYLFPGYRTGNRPVTPQALSHAVKRATRNFAGVELTPHQFRHLAAYRYLDDNPGHYEEVRRQLGHASVDTTTKYYSGTESGSAVLRFDEVILRRRQGLRRKPAGRNARQLTRPKRVGPHHEYICQARDRPPARPTVARGGPSSLGT